MVSSKSDGSSFGVCGVSGSLQLKGTPSQLLGREEEVELRLEEVDLGLKEEAELGLEEEEEVRLLLS